MKIFLTLFLAMAFITSNGQTAAASTQKAWFCPPCGGECDKDTYAAPGVCKHCGMQLIQESVAKRQEQMNAKRFKVLFYLQDGVEVLDFAGPLEVFSYAGFDISIVSRTKSPITSMSVLKVIPDYDIFDAPKADILAFFGGSSGNATNDTAVISWLQKAATPDYYFSVCTGAFILGKAGFLNGLTVTTFHESIEGLKSAVPTAKVLSDVRFVDNGKIITTAGISAGIDGALHLVERIRGREAASAIAKYMEYDKWVPEQGLIMHK